MGNLKRNYHRFLNQNRNKGIPRLMLWLCIANAVIFVLTYFFESQIATYLMFDSSAILRGEVWRLFTYVLTFALNRSFFRSLVLGAAFTILFNYWIGTLLEQFWGTLRFNIYYLAAMLMEGIFALLITVFTGYPIFYPVTSAGFCVEFAVLLAVATLIPQQRVNIYVVLPIKMKWLVWIDLGFTVYNNIKFLMQTSEYSTILGSWYTGMVLSTLLPLAAIGVYLLFFGRQAKYLLPDFLQNIGTRQQRKRRAEFRKKSQPDFRQEQQPNPNWAQNYRSSSGQKPYRHKCTVCGRTDTECPDLEFRYCSRCKGYFCYCIDHINNHTHVQ